MIGPSPTARLAAEPAWASVALGFAALAGAAVAAPLAAHDEALGIAALVGIAAGSAIAIRPELGAYLYLAVTPLIVGIERDGMIPVLRPNEALLLLMLSAFVARSLALMLVDRPWRPAGGRVGSAILLMALAASILPLLLRYGRSAPISQDDLLYAMVLWKYLMVFLFFREAVTTPAQVATCLWIALAASVLVALVAICQVLGLFGVSELLWTYYDQPFGGSTEVVTRRATSTIASSFGVASTMAISLIVALAWRRQTTGGETSALTLAAGIFLLGAVAAGQFSGFIGLTVAILAFGIVTRQLRRIARLLLPVGLLALLVLWPVIERRLSGFASPEGLPASWLGRIDNLERFVLPELSSGLNWLTGVRPAARLPAPEAWRDYVYIESGYAWLLWSGGIALLLAFAWFVRVALADLAAVLHATRGPVAVAAAGAHAGLVMIAVLMLFDPHLTMRGGADLFFPVLALALLRPGPAADAATAPPGSPGRRAGAAERT